MKRRGFFVTGTDTGIGKSWSSAALLTALRRRGHTALGMKPVASGCAETPDGLRSEDALLLLAQGTLPAPPYELINPYALAAPIAPHLAARLAGVEIRLERILAALDELGRRADFTVVEGVGGWRVPLNGRETVADLAGAAGLPVILVVGVRLGCLNHALLSAEAIRRGPGLAGWIANRVDADTAYPEENIASLRDRMDAPLLGVLPHLREFDADALAERIDLDALLRAAAEPLRT